MSFPWHNDSWRETAEFLGPRAVAGERILAPDAFWSIVSRVERYVPTNLVAERAYDWVVLDKGDVPQIPRAFLERVSTTMTPVFANKAFVVWSADATHAPDPDLEEHLGWFSTRLPQLAAEPSEPNRYAQDLALAAAPQIARFADLSDAELRAAMDEVFRTTGYLYPTRRDQGYRNDVDGHVIAFLERCHGTVLDLCAGGAPLVDVPGATSVVRTELSEVGIGIARTADGSRPGICHAVVDAHRTAFPDATFDGVLLVDSIEHVRDASLVLRDAARVLKSGGQLMVTFANRNSVHEVLARRLGYPEFPTNHQHIREFTLAEVLELLDDAGLEIVETSGITLYPYWGVPGVDQFVRRVTDDDPEFVDLMRELGRRVGAEYAYTGVVLARKSAQTAAVG